MVLDEVEGHLYRGHPEVVRAKIEDWQMQLLHDISSYDTSMITCIIQH